MRIFTKALAVAALMSASAVHAGTPQWTLSESSGNVNVLRAGVSKIAVTGSILRSGDIVAAGAKSRAVLVRGEEYVAVSPNSRVQISQPKTEGGVVQFFQDLGNVIFRIDRKATPHFGVETPYLAAVVKGTTFSVTVSDAGAAVQVTEGAVQVATLDGGATQLLSPGMIGMVERGKQFRLSISGAQAQTIDSPNAPIGSGDTPESLNEAALLEIATSNFEGIISAPVLEAPVSLGAVTNGLVQSSSSPQTTRLALSANPSSNLGFAVNNGNPGVAGLTPERGQGSDGTGNGDTNNGNGNGGSNNGNGNGNGGSNNGNGNGGSNNGNGNGDGGSNNGNGNGDGGSNNGNGNGGGPRRN